MAYAYVSDMVGRFGTAELIRLTTPEGQDLDTLDPDRVTRALEDASDLIDSYLRRRYAVPLETPTASIVRACCMIARHDLAFGSQTAPNKQMEAGRANAMTWLDDIVSGKVTLDGVEPIGEASFAQTSDRGPPAISDQPCIDAGGNWDIINPGLSPGGCG